MKGGDAELPRRAALRLEEGRLGAGTEERPSGLPRLFALHLAAADVDGFPAAQLGSLLHDAEAAGGDAGGLAGGGDSNATPGGTRRAALLSRAGGDEDELRTGKGEDGSSPPALLDGEWSPGLCRGSMYSGSQVSLASRWSEPVSVEATPANAASTNSPRFGPGKGEAVPLHHTAPLLSPFQQARPALESTPALDSTPCRVRARAAGILTRQSFPAGGQSHVPPPRAVRLDDIRARVRRLHLELHHRHQARQQVDTHVAVLRLDCPRVF